MISNEEITHLASLARLSFSETETESYQQDIKAILGYIDQIESVEMQETDEYTHRSRNVMRDDVVTEQQGEHTQTLTESAPATKDKFIRVQKVL